MRRLSHPEFIALMALLWSSLAFALDSLLPALPEIASSFSPDDPNKAQLVLATFLFGMGIGVLIFGPLSDQFGRKPTLIFGLVLYCIGAFLGAIAESLETLLLARTLQGLGGASTRVVSTALIRDLYMGREMARITSFVMTVFLLVPAAAPAVGQMIIFGFGWRAIFVAFILFGVIALLWLSLRQPETLPVEKRRKSSIKLLVAGSKDILGRRPIVIYTLVLSLGFGQMFALLASIQPIYEGIFDKASSFPTWFAIGAGISLIGTLLNARFVDKIGMRRMATGAYVAQVLISGTMLLGTAMGHFEGTLAFAAFYIWSVSIFFMAGMTFGNLTALSLAPLGHLAGLASSLVQGLSTIGAVLIAAPVGLAYNGTVTPVVSAAFVCSFLALMLMRSMRDS